MVKRTVVFILAVLCAFSLCACRESADVTEGGFTVASTGNEYVLCRFLSVYAVNAGDPYVKYGSELVYEVQFEDPNEFLCVYDSMEYLVYRNKSLPELTVDSFAPVAAMIYDGTNTRWIASFFADDEYLPEDQRGINESQDTYVCRAIAEALTEGENVDVASDNMALSNRYFIRLTSQNYPGLFYTVFFFCDNNGVFYLRDRAINKNVVCPREVLERMIGGSAAEAAEGEEL